MLSATSSGRGGSFSTSRCARNPEGRTHPFRRQRAAERQPQLPGAHAPPQPLGCEPGEFAGLAHTEGELTGLVLEREQHALGEQEFFLRGHLRFLARLFPFRSRYGRYGLLGGFGGFGGWVGRVFALFFVRG
ncbi:hypothetical protein GA0115255_126013 [Streptomyces sp. Ncost-T6T-2b]|nr:hypothetical protein GA0115255_126013 [Streptomyces sp. Ncost-T6T-2b]